MKHDEEDLQAAIWQHVKLLQTPDTIAYAVPNGGPRSPRYAARLKAQGVVAGVGDLAFVLSDGSAAFLELKIKGGRQSEAQRAFEARCIRMGVPYMIAYDIDGALAILRGWGIIKGQIR